MTYREGKQLGCLVALCSAALVVCGLAWVAGMAIGFLTSQ